MPELDDPQLLDVMSLYMSGRSLDDVAICRHFVMAACRHEDPETANTAALLTSEVVTNTLIHGDRSRCNLAAGGRLCLKSAHPFLLDLEFRAAAMLVRVAGPGSQVAVVQPASGVDRLTCGRGLAMVDALSSQWDTHGNADSRTVWFELKRAAASADAL